MQEKPKNRVAQYASVQAMAEIGIGSLVHSLHIPLGGHALSINQVLCLGLTTRQSPGRFQASRDALGSASAVALLKLSSPAGKRLMPMLAIFTQGLLFAAGLFAVGANVIGAALGAALMSVWGFAQPLIMAYLLFGLTFFQAAERLWNDVAKQLGIEAEVGIWLIVIAIVVKMILAIFAAILAWTSDPRFESKYLERVDMLWKRAKARGMPMPAATPVAMETPKVGDAARGAVTDLINPLFLASLFLCVLFLREEAGMFVLRTVALTFALFFTIRMLSASRLAKWLQQFQPKQN